MGRLLEKKTSVDRNQRDAVVPAEDVNRDTESVGKANDSSNPTLPKFDDMSRAQIGIILSSLGLVMFLFAIEETIVATSVSSIGEALDLKGSLAWISTSYFLTSTVIQPILGRIAV
ncbi:hypothetical protein L218DRAFT_958344 [Marasmius fiardii PR-910]|nr:hypothetical protein L218DRAFT_958344 [Marasmius fiardii PR-910]